MAEAVQGSPENYKGMYGALKFPAYKRQDYPKLLYRDDGKVLGTANNAMEEKELFASIGVEKADIDPLGAAQDEVALLRAKLAQYEGDDASKAVAPEKTSGVKTATVQMLPEEAPAPKSNPLLPKQAVAAPAGDPSPKGTAPVVNKQIDPGV